MRFPWAIVALAVILPVSGCGKKGDAETTAETAAGPVAVETALAVERPMEVTVEAPGTLATGQGRSARVAPVAAGRVAEVFVKEGDAVTQGQALVALDPRPAEAAAQGAASALAASDAQAREARTAAGAAAMDQKSAVHLAENALEAARLERDSSVQQARSSLDQAETDLKKTKAGPRAQEVAQADQAVRQAKSTRERAATELDRVTFLHGKGIVARRQLDDAKTALDVADAGLETAKQQAAMAHEGSRPEDVHAAELRLSAAKDALAAAISGGNAKVRQAEISLRQAKESALQVTVKRQEAAAMRATAAQRGHDLAAAKAAAGYTVLRSPLAGFVVRRSVNPGDMADPATPAIEVANTRSLDLMANLPAEDGIAVRPGMAAHVRSGETTVTGRVLSVGQVDPQTNLMPVRIVLNNAGGTLKAGGFAVASIVLKTDRTAVVVPKQAVVTREGKALVFSVADGLAHQREVTVGAERDGTVEIVKGIRRGETVIRLGQYELADGAKVKPAGTKEQ